MKCKKKIKEDELHLKKERNRKWNALEKKRKEKKGIPFLKQEKKNCTQPKKKRVFLFLLSIPIIHVTMAEGKVCPCFLLPLFQVNTMSPHSRRLWSRFMFESVYLQLFTLLCSRSETKVGKKEKRPRGCLIEKWSEIKVWHRTFHELHSYFNLLSHVPTLVNC